jgi:hypothetical protein
MTDEQYEFGLGEARTLARLLQDVTRLQCTAKPMDAKTKAGRQAYAVDVHVKGAEVTYRFTTFASIASFVATKVSGRAQ